MAHQSRPDLLFDVTKIANNLNKGSVGDILDINKIICKAKNSKLRLKFQSVSANLNEGVLHVVLYTDAALGNMPDGGSQAGYLIMLAGDSGTFSPIWWNSKKIRRVVRSTLAAETLAMAEGIDASIFICTLLGELVYGKPEANLFPIVCFTDCKSLHDALKSPKFVSEKRLRLEISGIKEQLQKGQVKRVEWISSDLQLADCLTKKGAVNNELRKALHSGVLTT